MIVNTEILMFIFCKAVVPLSHFIRCFLSWEKTIIGTSVNAQIFISIWLFIFQVISALEKKVFHFIPSTFEQFWRPID